MEQQASGGLDSRVARIDIVVDISFLVFDQQHAEQAVIGDA